jgi:hypothetical protein
MQSDLLLQDKGNPSATVNQEGTRFLCQQLNISYHAKLCVSVEDAIDGVNQWKGKVSAIIVGNQAIDG